MKDIPKKLNICPLEEAVFEIRFSSDTPPDAIFGIIYSSVKDIFPKESIKQLPVQQIPEQIRLKDPNLKYQALHRLQKDNLSLSIGPNTLIFGNTKEYLGWHAWSTFFHSILNEVEKTEVLSKVERIGLRYINIFDNNILENTNVKLLIDNNQLLHETSNLRTELVDSGFIKVLQIGNAVNITSNNQSRIGSIIDIDCIYNFKDEDFFKDYSGLINMAHEKEKELFFTLLNDEFLKSLNPKY